MAGGKAKTEAIQEDPYIFGGEKLTNFGCRQKKNGARARDFEQGSSCVHQGRGDEKRERKETIVQRGEGATPNHAARHARASSLGKGVRFHFDSKCLGRKEP